MKTAKQTTSLDASSDAPQAQPFSACLEYTYLAEKAGVPLSRLFWDAATIVDVYRKARAGLVPEPIAKVLAPQLAAPQLASLSYGHVSALGCPILRPEHGEPSPRPIICPDEYDFRLEEPTDYLAAGILPERCRVAGEVEALWGGGCQVAHGLNAQGPITTAVLLAGHDFLMWPYDNPAAAHRLLDFVTRSATNFIRCVRDELGTTWFMTDDFAGLLGPELFEEFVVPYWYDYFRRLGATTRYMHSELLRPEHLPFLIRLGVTRYDPGCDQYLTPELLRDHCPVPFHLQIKPAEVRDLDTDRLLSLYRHYASFHPATIQFNLEHPDEEAKFLALYQLAHRLSGASAAYGVQAEEQTPVQGVQ